MLSTDKDWKKWGEKDPYFGVVSHPEFRSGSIEQNRDGFFNSGEKFVAEVLSQADRCFGGVKQRTSALRLRMWCWAADNSVGEAI